MNKVTTINLNGRAFQMEESGYDALRAYLDEAKVALNANPDKDEILSDLEQAVADKLSRFLNPNKTVVLKSEIDTVLKEMGPVEGSSESQNAGEEKKTQNSAHKRLYNIREGAMIGGVCTGLAAYLGIDVAIVRVLFAIFALITHGFGVLVYFVMMWVVPYAKTDVEKAAAYGVPPITAKELIDRAKENYSNFKNSREWHQWKRQMRSEMREWKRNWKNEWRNEKNPYYRMSPWAEAVHSLLGLLWFLIIVFLIWYAYNHFIPVHDFINQFPVWWHQSVDWLSNQLS